MKKYFFSIGGAGNVFFQVVKARKLNCEYMFSDFFVSSAIRNVLGHTVHKNVYKSLFNIPSGGTYMLPIFLLDVLFAKTFRFSLFTTLDLRTTKVRPLLMQLVYCGYFQDGVDVVDIYNSGDVINLPKSSEEFDLCVHIRGGDFSSVNNTNKATMPLTKDYYINAFNKMEGVNDIKKIAVVTNDQKMSMEILDEIGLTNYELFSGDELSDFCMMNNSKKVICSNSTFAIMAALSSRKITDLVMPRLFEEKFTNFNSLPFKVQFVE